jgi:hypothetical protein
MASGSRVSTRERNRTAALAVGLAATIITWTFAVAFAPEQLDSLSRYSPWLYGPVATAAWAAFSAIAYLLISRDRLRRASIDSHEGYRCRELMLASKGDGCSVCANEEEKNRLGAVTAGFAVTITGWVAALSFMPDSWLDWLGGASAWVYCLASLILWATSSRGMYLIFSASRAKFR